MRPVILSISPGLHHIHLLCLAPLLVHAMAARLLLFLARWGSAKGKGVGSLSLVLFGSAQDSHGDILSSCSRPKKCNVNGHCH